MSDQCVIIKDMKTEKRSERPSPPKSALRRLYLIDQQIASGKYPNTKYLVEYMRNEWGDITISTISRDIAYMKDTLNAPIEYNALHRGYYYSKPYYRIPLGFSGAEELLALGMAKNILTLFRETPLYEASAHLLECITAPLVSDGNQDWLENRIVIPKIASAKINPDIWKTVVTALKENRIITFEYLRIGNEDYQSRCVHPYQLLYDSGVWYLYGFSQERKAVRIFSLTRIKKAVITKDHFALPDNFGYSNSTGGSYFGVFIGEEKFHFIIACYKDAIIYATERQWADDQKNIPFDGGIKMEFTSTQYDKVLQWLLSNGCNAVPRKPKRLVEDWKRHIQKMHNLTINKQ